MEGQGNQVRLNSHLQESSSRYYLTLGSVLIAEGTQQQGSVTSSQGCYRKGFQQRMKVLEKLYGSSSPGIMDKSNTVNIESTAIQIDESTNSQMNTLRENYPCLCLF